MIRIIGSPAADPTDCVPEHVETWTDAKAGARAAKASAARRASGRRRNIDPATCERDYTAAEVEFRGAMQEYKRTSGRMFPTWSETLEVLQALGYAKAEADATGMAV